MTRVVMVEHPGGPEVMSMKDVELKPPGRGEARVRVEYAGVNFLDVYYRRGEYPMPTPFVPGFEGAGVVEAVGPDVTLRPGQRVAWLRQPGSYAEALNVSADAVVPLPEGVDARAAASVMMQGVTAHFLTHDTYPVKPGDVVLVHAAAGGVGSLLVQIAKRRGARVLAAVSTEAKARMALALGADEVIVDFDAEARRLTGGVDVAYDGVGLSTWRRSLASLRRRGTLVIYGQASGPVPPLDPDQLKKGSLYLTRPTVADYTATPAELAARAADVFRWLRDGELTVSVDRELPLHAAAEAHEALEGRRTKGKVLLRP